MGQLLDPSVEPDFTAALNSNVVFLLLGVFGWEYFQSLQAEYALVCGRLAFRLSLIPYILGRICLLLFLVLLAAGTSSYSVALNCLPGLLTISVLGNIALGCSSTIFMIRTWVIWKESRWAHALLLLLALGQWTMMVIEVVVNIKTINVDGVCEAYVNYPQIDAAALIYTTLYDLLVLVLLVVGLSSEQSESPLKRRLRAQGIVYFAVAVIAYIPSMVSALLCDSSEMIPFSITSITVSTIVSSRAARSLYYLDTSDSCEASVSDALTTQIGIQQTIVQEGTPGGRHCADEADRC